MRIRERTSIKQRPANTRHAIKLRTVVYLLTAVVLLAGGYLLGALTPDFWRSPWRSLLAAIQGNDSIPSLYLDIPFSDYQRLLSQRENALKNGANVHTGDDENWGEGQMRLADQTTSTSIRLMAAPASAFSGDFWPFELDFSDFGEDSIMQQAYLVPIIDEKAIKSAGFLTSLDQIGEATVAYQWVHLYVNGAKWGLYSIVESPLSMNIPVVTLDSTAWLETLTLDGEFSPTVTYPYAGIFVSEVENSAQQMELDTVGLVVQRLLDGDSSAINSLDTVAWGRYLALHTFWCGSTWPDWRTSAWTFDQDNSQLLPVGVPCTTVGDKQHALPQTLFTNLDVQKTYVDELYTLATLPSHAFDNTIESLSELYTVANPVLDDLPSPDQWISHRQEHIMSMLSPSHSVLAWISSEHGQTTVDDSTLAPSQVLHLNLVNPLPVPVEILGFDMSENGFLPASTSWVEGSPSLEWLVIPASYGTTPITATLQVPLDDSIVNWDSNMQIVTRIWGAEPADALPLVSVTVQVETP